MKKLISILICIVMVISLCACAGSAENTGDADVADNTVSSETTGTADVADNTVSAETTGAADVADGADTIVNTTSEIESDISDLAELVIDNFMPLTQIPRGTYNEQAVSDYLKDWAQDRGFEVTQDECNNIIFDVPATKGCEDAPMVALQVHMDMVVVADDNYDFNPSTNPIKVINDGETLTAEHTSLGADDGIGIAITQYIVEHSEKHGPLRIIITTDEERTQTGAMSLDSKYLEGVEYLINIDSEEDDTITISSASCIELALQKEVTKVPVTGNAAYKVSITGSAGGHSGLEIDDSRVNSIVALCDFLYYLRDKGIDYQLVSAKSGSAPNAIPASAEAIIVMDSSKKDELMEDIASFAKLLKDTYSIHNPDIDCVLEDMATVPEYAMSPEDANALICYAQNAICGVYTLSQKQPGLVESSSNIGILKADTSQISFSGATRSSELSPELHIIAAKKNLAETLGFTIKIDETCVAWPVGTDNTLCDIAAAIYKDNTGTDANISALHAGLECGFFAQNNPDIDIISIGPSVIGAHSTSENVSLRSIAKVTKWVDKLVAALAK